MKGILAVLALTLVSAGCGEFKSPPGAEQRLDSVVVVTTDTILGTRREAAFSVKAKFMGSAAEMSAAEGRACRLFESATKRDVASLQACYEQAGFQDVKLWKPN